MANDQPAPNWRNLATWGAVGALGYILVVCGAVSLIRQDGLGELLGALPRSAMLAAWMGMGLVFATAVVGFSNRKRPVTPRNLRNFMVRDVMVFIAFLLFVWGFSALGRAGYLRAMGASEWAAAATGSILIFFGLLGSLVMSSTHTSANLVDDEMAAEDMRERSRLFLCSFGWMVACGLLLVGLSLAGPERLLSPVVALSGTLILIAVLTMLGIAAWRMSDELGRTLSHETGNLAFYLIIVLGGGWTILAHLGFVAGPGPVGWLTLFIVLLFVASIIATGRRKLFTH